MVIATMIIPIGIMVFYFHFDKAFNSEKCQKKVSYSLKSAIDFSVLTHELGQFNLVLPMLIFKFNFNEDPDLLGPLLLLIFNLLVFALLFPKRAPFSWAIFSHQVERSNFISVSI